jgi:hypothetical protein
MHKLLLIAFVALFGLDVILVGPLAAIGMMAIAALGALLAIKACDIWRMRRNPHYHCWPSVTTCRLCMRRIFAWQRKERRPVLVHVDDPDCLDVGIGGSCLVHRGCFGTPTADASVRLGPRSRAA